MASLGRELVAPAFGLWEALSSGGAELAADPRASDLRARVERTLASNPPLHARDLALNGARIMEILDVQPSPVVGEAARHLLDRVLQRPELNTADALADILREWAKARGG
jgi:hypothetical protein